MSLAESLPSAPVGGPVPQVMQKYDASILSGQWNRQDDACPCCPHGTVMITALGDDAFRTKSNRGEFTYKREVASDDFNSTRHNILARVLNENEMRIIHPKGGSFTLTRASPIDKTNVAPTAPVPQVMQNQK